MIWRAREGLGGLEREGREEEGEEGRVESVLVLVAVEARAEWAVASSSSRVSAAFLRQSG